MSRRWLGILTSRLRNKIVLPYIILTLILALVSTFLLTRLVIGPVQDRLSNFLQDAAREANDALIEKQRDQLASLRAMLHTEGVASSVAAGSVSRLQVLLLPIKLNDRLDALEVIDGDGRELLGILQGPDAEALSDYQIRSGADLSSWPLVTRVLASPSPAQNPRSLELIETERGYILYSGAPVLLNGYPVGAILVGNYLPNVVEEIGLQSLAQITLYDPEGQFLASTLPQAAEEGSPFAQMRTDLRTQLAAASGALRTDLSWQGRRYALIYAPLYLEQEAAGYLSVALPIDFLAESATQSQAWLIILFTFASFAVLAIGYLLAERITAPLHQLMLASQQVAHGDFSKRIEARSGDEIDTLATAFNTMSENLQEYADQLHQRIGELSLLYEASAALGRSLNIDQVLQVALDVICHAGRLDFALLLLRNRSTGLYVYRSLQGQDLPLGHLLQKSVAPPTPDPLWETLQQPSPQWVAQPEAPQLAEALGLPPWYGALILIPLLSADEPLGLVIGGKAETEGFASEASVVLLRTLATEAARAIQNALLYEEVTQRLQQLLTVQQISQAITAKLSLPEVLDQLMEELVGILGGGAAVLALLDQERGGLEVRATRGVMEDLRREWPGRAVAEWVAAQGQAILYDQEALPLLPTPGHPPDSGNSMCAPLSVEREIIGTVDVRSRDSQHRFDRQDMLVLTTVANQAAVALKNAQLYEEIRSLYLSVVQSLAAAIDARDPSTHGHSHRVTHNTLAVARQLGISVRELRLLEIASYLHDIGKIGVRDEVLLKPGELSREERRQMGAHPLIGARILEPVGFDPEVIRSVLHHHERYDGQGYPDGLGGGEIPLGARILGAVDAFDAMISDRPYREAMTLDEALVNLQEGAGAQFDPQVVQALVACYKKGALLVPNPSARDLSARRMV